MSDLSALLEELKERIPGCTSLSVTSIDGLPMATTLGRDRGGDFIAAITSHLLTDCARHLTPIDAGACRVLDYRGDRQVLVAELEGVAAYVVVVLDPEANDVHADHPGVVGARSALAVKLRGQEAQRNVRFYFERDSTFRFPLQRRLLFGRAPHCDVILSGAKIADEHMVVELAHGTALAREIDGVARINRKTLKGKTVALEPGDRLTLPGSKGFTLLAVDRAGALAGQSKKKKTSKKKKKG